MNLTEQLISRREIYHGRIIAVQVDTVSLPNGNTSTREVVRHPGGVGILALDDEGCAVLVEQYRYVFDRTLLELREETGAEAAHWQPLGAVLPSPGCYGEVLHLYLARDLTFGATHPDADEFLQVRRLPFDTLLARCLSGEIEDGKTVAAVLKAKLLGL